jgi:hypothetical protein
MQTMRVPVGRVPQIKCEGRKIPFIKNARNNFDEKNETNPKRQKLSLTKYKKLTS